MENTKFCLVSENRKYWSDLNTFLVRFKHIFGQILPKLCLFAINYVSKSTNIKSKQMQL